MGGDRAMLTTHERFLFPCLTKNVLEKITDQYFFLIRLQTHGMLLNPLKKEPINQAL